MTTHHFGCIHTRHACACSLYILPHMPRALPHRHTPSRLFSHQARPRDPARSSSSTTLTRRHTLFPIWCPWCVCVCALSPIWCPWCVCVCVCCVVRGVGVSEKWVYGFDCVMLKRSCAPKLSRTRTFKHEPRAVCVAVCFWRVDVWSITYMLMHSCASHCLIHVRISKQEPRAHNLIRAARANPTQTQHRPSLRSATSWSAASPRTCATCTSSSS